MTGRVLPALPAHSGRVPGGWSAVIAAVWAAITLVSSQLSLPAFVTLAAGGLLVIGLVGLARGRGIRIDPAEALPFFILYFLFGFLLRGLGLLGGVDSQYLRAVGDPSSPYFLTLLGWSLFYAALSLLAVRAGYGWRALDAWIDNRIARKQGWSTAWRADRTLPVGLGLIALGMVGAILRLHGLGGLAAAVDDPVLAGTSGSLGKFWTVALTEFAVVGYHVIVLGWCLRGERHIARKAFAVGLLLAAPLYILTSSKFVILRVLLPPVLFLSILRGRLRFTHLVGALAGFGALFPLFYAYRALGLHRLSAVGTYLATTDTPWLKLYNRSYDTDSFMIILHRLHEGQSLLWGRSLADLGTFFIPRDWWPDKPASFGLTFPAQFMPDVDFGSMTYVTPSLPGELFVNFHLPGVLLGSLLLGLLARAAWRVGRSGHPGAMLFYGYVFLTVVHLVEGAIASQIETLLTGLVPAWLAHRALSAKPVERAAKAAGRLSASHGIAAPGSSA